MTSKEPAVERHEGAKRSMEPVQYERQSVDKECCESRPLLRYARGFLFSSTVWVGPPDHWRQTQFAGGWLYWDSRVEAVLCSCDAGGVAILGRAIDLERGTADMKVICRMLAAARRDSSAAFQAVVDRLCGRFVVIDLFKTRISVQQDAAGMRTVYYCNDSGSGSWYVGSHARLINDVVGGDLPQSIFGDHWRDGVPHILRGAYGYPGRASAFEGVYALTPNTVLDVASGTVRRIFPESSPGSLSSRDAGERMSSYFDSQFHLLSRTSQLLFSLTSGLDSRVTLAAAKRVSHQSELFTYAPPTHKRDVDVALRISREFGLKHRLLDLDDFSEFPPGFMGALRANCPRRHISRAALAYLRTYSQDALHIRSNHYEIGRAFFLKHRPSKPRMDPEIMQRRLLESTGEAHPAILDAFSEWVDFTAFPYQSGYLPQDMFYWEHRMSRWCAENLCESDVAFDTWTIVNSRLLYQLMLAVPFEDRLSGAAFLHVIRKMWPELLRVPINSVSYN